RPRDLSGLLRRGAVVLIVFMTVQVFYSPQWVLWVLPLVLPLTDRERGLAWVLFALDLVTFHTFPVWPPLGPASAFGAEVLFVIRFGILGYLAFVLLRAEWRETHPAWNPERHAPQRSVLGVETRVNGRDTEESKQPVFVPAEVPPGGLT